MPGMTLGGRTTSSPILAAIGGYPMWTLMVLAVTLPTTIPAAQHVAVNSFRDRQWPAVGEFLSVYLALWLAFGLVAMLIMALLPAVKPGAAMPMALALAVAWELTPWKRRALNRCHRSSPLPPRGWRARRAVGRFAWINGSACIASCWATMLAMMLAPTARLLWAVALAGLMAYEKFSRKPRRATRRAAGLLAAVAVGVALTSFAGADVAEANEQRPHSSPSSNTAKNASWGTSTRPTCFIRFLPSFCLPRSFFLREMSPP
jgi:predicted metal-binding membrane protein